MTQALLQQKCDELAAAGYTKTSELITMCIKQKKDITINDGNDEAWDSGFADWLMKNFNWNSNRLSFTAKIKYDA